MINADLWYNCLFLYTDMVLHLHSPHRHMDTSLIDVDVQPTYARLNVKGKVGYQAFISQISQ